MKSLTIRLPNALVTEIEHESRLRRISKSDVVRERLCQPQQAGSDPGGVSAVVGEILQKSWQAHVPPAAPRFASRKKQRLAELIRAKKLHR